MIPRPLARRLDRLARRAHAFHRFAHHPLCDEYAGEVIPLGRRARVCRGCAYVVLGTIGGLLAGAVFRLPPLLMWVLAALLIITTPLTIGARRPGKWRSRLFPAALLGAVAGSGSLLWTALAVVTFAAVFAAYRQRTPDRTPCQTCPERLSAVPCRGLRPIVRRERAFQRVANRMVARALVVNQNR